MVRLLVPDAEQVVAAESLIENERLGIASGARRNAVGAWRSLRAKTEAHRI